MNPKIINHRRQQVLYDTKWFKFLSRTRPFRHIPFVDFVFAAGSMALGNIHPESDFDVIVAAKRGRIFMARFFAILAFGSFGWRRTKLNHKETAADKICLNHFITEKSYRLSPPHNDYWKNLYLNLVPIFGEPENIHSFWAANADWLAPSPNPALGAGLNEVPKTGDDLRRQSKKSSLAKLAIERALSGKIGDWLEAGLKKIQVSRIEHSLKSQLGHQPRIIYGDDELEFHPDTKRVEDFLDRGLRN